MELLVLELKLECCYGIFLLIFKFFLCPNLMFHHQGWTQKETSFGWKFYSYAPTVKLMFLVCHPVICWYDEISNFEVRILILFIFSWEKSPDDKYDKRRKFLGTLFLTWLIKVGLKILRVRISSNQKRHV